MVYMKLVALALAALLTALAANPAIPPANKDKTLGSLSAPVTIELFSDFECPMCRTFHMETLPKIVQDFVAPGKARIVSREFPLNIHAHKFSRDAANYATAAARIGKYDAVVNALFQNPESWGESGKVWETVAAVLSPEQQKKVQALAKDPAVLAEVQSDVSYATSSGVNSTPTLIVSRGSTRYPVAGSMSYNLLKSLLNDMAK